MKNPYISVIIPAHNEEKYIEKTLSALRTQSFASYEVIVVANACTDQTATRARKKGVRVIVTEKAGISAALNRGAREARAPILLCLDADTLLEPNALKVVAQEFSAAYAVGTLRARPTPSRWNYRSLYAYKNFMHRSRLYMGSSGVILVWKRIHKHIKGFNTRLHCRENRDFIQRALSYGKYKYIASAYATTSMRRYERRGMLSLALFWIKTWVLSQFRKHIYVSYEVVR